jgi:hypothetical protein
MRTCDDCGEEINHRPMNEGALGGDWVASCSICEWHSEDEGDSRIILNPTKEQIISQKKMLNELYDLVYHLHFNGNIKPIQLDEVLDKIREVKDSMIMEVDE